MSKIHATVSEACLVKLSASELGKVEIECALEVSGVTYRLQFAPEEIPTFCDDLMAYATKAKARIRCSRNRVG